MNLDLKRQAISSHKNLSQSLWKRKRVGIFGGSFNPPHQGHMHIASEALNIFNLDSVWWMVSPKNPLKTTSGKDDFNDRFQRTKEFIHHHPKMIATEIEYLFDTDYSYKTVERLTYLYPDTEFIWIAGMDNAALFHQWNEWDKLIDKIPFVFFNRPPFDYRIRRCKLNLLKNVKHIYDIRNEPNKLKPKRIYWMYTGRSVNMSSTLIRKSNHEIR